MALVDNADYTSSTGVVALGRLAPRATSTITSPVSVATTARTCSSASRTASTSRAKGGRSPTGSSLSAPAAIGADQSFLVWGDANGSLTTSTPVTSATLTYERLDRTWQAQEIGSVGDVQLASDTSFPQRYLAAAVPAGRQRRTFGSPRLVTGTLSGSQVVYGVDLAKTLSISRWRSTPPIGCGWCCRATAAARSRSSPG